MLLLLMTTFLFLQIAKAQPQAYETKTDYQKSNLAAAAIDLPYSTDVVESAVKDVMASKGWKGTGQKGFTVYRGARLTEGSAAANDVYVRIDRRGKDKNSSTITLFAVKPSEDPASRAADAVMPMDDAKTFLNNLVPSVEAHDLEVQIGVQEQVTKKSKKKYANLQDDQSDLEKKIRDAQSDLVQNKKDQVDQSALVQANISGDQDALKKAQKKMNKLLDEQASLEKKIRKYTTQLAENKNDQTGQQADVNKQQQALDTMKLRRKTPGAR
jgi:hypothetical protein